MTPLSGHSKVLGEILAISHEFLCSTCMMQWVSRKPGELLEALIYQLLAYITWRLMLWLPGKGIVASYSIYSLIIDA